MKKHSRLVSRVAAAALGAVLVAGLWAIITAPLGQVRRLPDGSTLTLDAVTYGRAHPYVHGSRWQKWLYPLLSPALRDRSGLWSPSTGWESGTGFSRGPHSLVLQAKRGGRFNGRVGRVAAVAADTRDVELAPGLGSSGEFWRMDGGVHEAYELPVFPRRARDVRVHVYEQAASGEWARVAEFVVANPTPGHYPTWTPQSLPITRHAGDLAVTLTRITNGIIPEDPYHRSPPGDDTWTRAQFQFSQRGRPTNDWTPTTVTISDATGNTWTHQNQDRWLEGSGSRLQFAGSLPRTETAWKLRVQFLRHAGFSPGELWSLTGVPVPAPNQRPLPIATGRRLGVQLSWSATGKGRSSGPYGYQPPPFTSVDLTASPRLPDLRPTLLRATDDQGRTIHPVTVEPFSIGDRYRYWLEPTPAGARRMNLLFALQRARTVEFMVAPP